MNAEEYLKARLDNQIDWYDRKSSSNQRAYKHLRLAEFVLAAFLPFLAGFAALHWGLQLAVGLAGVAIAIIAASLSLYQFEQNWIKYRTTCESLRRQKYLFLTRTDPYRQTAESNLTLLVQAVEQLVSDENSQWTQTMQAREEKAQGQ
jgi:hypothetical protein